MSMSQGEATTKAVPEAQVDKTVKKDRKPKFTFMLHDPTDMSSCGKYQSSDYRYAALKAASKGAEKILLRKTNTKEVREFTGSNLTLDTPKEISRGGRTIQYHKKPAVKFVKKFSFNGDLPEDEDAEEAKDTGSGPEAPPESLPPQ